MKTLKIVTGVPNEQDIASKVKEIEEQTDELKFDNIDIEIGIAPKPIVDDETKYFDDEEE
ncbi:hypothetical protein H6Y62_09265 [Staphylococcus lugdunensis]|uniref:hypothetical protein n=1 Tax=Staphylococcus TaxID=1279 RepID=UPI001933B896|nr:MULTISPECIES: hypothetical protein [Staphylococcus]MCI2771278.1 hypothetical protein [Staphylococcus warneri]MCI2783028.1 hypothetical protein [Staphylococcus warneri]QRF15908.1 hypothetical protein H6Y62_09265 [Staphylococcus lugdunensis]